MEHVLVPLGERHPPHNWEYATEVALQSAVGFTVDDIGGVALQLDAGKYWRLTDNSPVTWELTGARTKGDVGLGNADNTSDADKPVSTAQALADTAVYNAATAASTPVAHATDTNNPHSVTKTQVGLGNVDNTSDADKPVSTAQALADTAVYNAAMAASTPVAHATDTNNPHSVTKAQVGLGNVDNTSDADKPVSTAQATALAGKTNMTGFPVDSSGNYLCTLSYNETTRTVTITPTGASFDIYIAGVKHTFTGAQSIAHSATGASHFVYVNASGVLTAGTSPWDLLLHAPVCYVFQDVTNSRRIPFDERHHAGRDLYWHRNQHANEGTKISSGFAASGYTLNNGASDGVLQVAIASGRVEDEDIRVDTQAVAAAGPYNLLYRSGASGDWLITRTSVLPFFYSGNNLQYNQNTGSTWQLTNVTEDYFVNYWVFALTALPTTGIAPTPSSTQQIVIVAGQAIYSSQALADAEMVSSLAYGSVPFQEMGPLYKLTFRFNAANPSAYTNTARTALVAISRVVGSFASVTATAQMDHGALTGLTDQDHPASAIIFTPTGNIAATDVQAAIAELDSEKNTLVEATVTASGSNAALTITQTGSGNALLIEDSATPDSTPVLVDANGRVIVGHTASVTAQGITAQIQNHGTSAGQGGGTFSNSYWQNNSTGSELLLNKSRSATPGSFTIVQANDGLGIVAFGGDDGTALIRGAAITAEVDGTPGANDMPTRLIFSTTADGASSPTERLRISSSGAVSIAGAFSAGSYTTPATAGTTPTYGSDLLAGIGAFTDATGWTLGSGWSITGGQAVYTSGGGTLDATIAVTSGNKYQIDWTHVAGSYTITASIGAVSVSSAGANRSLTLVAGATGSLTLAIAMSAGATIDGLTVKQVTAAGRAIAYKALDAGGLVALELPIYTRSLINTVFGRDCLANNTTGYQNSAFGLSALYSNTTGYYNTAFSINALYFNTVGYSNTAFGVSSLQSNTTGSTNTAYGFNSLFDVTTGSANVGIGNNTGRGVTTGTGNTILGANVTGLSAGLTNNIVIANGTGAIKAQHDGTSWTFSGGVVLDKTITAGGTTGAQTINKPAGTVNFAASATSLVVTNSFVTSNSVIICTVGTNDTTMKSVAAVAASGSFTLYANSAATAETRVNFLVIN